MGRAAIVLAITLVSTPAWGQQRVKMSPKDIQKYGLKASVENTYAVYTFMEYKKLRLDLTRLQAVTKKLGLLEAKIPLLETKLKAVGKQAGTLKQDLQGCLKSRKRVTEKWKKCDLAHNLCQAGQWKPWVITAASIAVAIVGISLGAYYGDRYRKAK